MKLTLSVSLVALFAATTLGCASGQTSQLDVLVLDPSGAAVQFAEIVVRDDAGYKIASGSTNGSGGFDLKNVGPGAYEVVTRAFGFEAHTETVVIPEGIVSKLVVKLAASPDALKSGLDVLLSDPSGAVIPNVQVLVENQERIKIVTGTTNMAGRIRLAGLSPGTYVLTVRCSGFKDLKDTLNVQPGQMLGVRLTLQVGSVIWTGGPYSAPLVATETSSLFALIPEETLPAAPQPAPRQESPHNSRLRRFFSAIGHKLGL
jgi:hypothetical protein